MLAKASLSGGRIFHDSALAQPCLNHYVGGFSDTCRRNHGRARAFMHTSQQTAAIGNGSAAERRNLVRLVPPVPLPARLVIDGRQRICCVENISPRGARLHLAGDGPFNLEMRLEVPLLGVVYATRAWYRHERLGIRFQEEFDPTRLRAVCGLGLGSALTRQL
ncbi:MAG: PilZ domain-containing protein [Alphaproteobacteria bacterium]|nr:MAG: PilZ domain-containing protein [Alphaproteobacteria bacterium]